MIQSSQVLKALEKSLFIIRWALCQGKNGKRTGHGRAGLITPRSFPCPQQLFRLTFSSISNTLEWLTARQQPDSPRANAGLICVSLSKTITSPQIINAQIE